MSTLRCPEAPRMPDNGCDRSRNLATAAATSVSRGMWTSTELPRTARPVKGMRAWRSSRSTSSASDCRRSLRTALLSTSRRRCEPPCRSRPSTMCRCAQVGQRFTVLSLKKFGTANRHMTSAVSTMPAAFHRVKNNIGFEFPRYVATQRRSARAVVLDRLALGTHIGHHRAHLPHLYAVGDLDLDLVVVDHLGDLADETAVGHHGIAAAQRLDHGLVLLGPLLLRTQHQEIHDHDDQDQRHQRRNHP